MSASLGASPADPTGIILTSGSDSHAICMAWHGDAGPRRMPVGPEGPTTAHEARHDPGLNTE
jgi:hypothetical protein